MIKIIRGNILEADAKAIVNAVNCVGVMGRGIALQFRKVYPGSFSAYNAACSRKELEPGKVLTHVCGSHANPRYIIHFPTKAHWKGNSRLSYIEEGLKTLVKEVERLSIRSMALPALGCGLGGLDRADVRTRIETAFASLPEVRVLLYEPGDASP